MKKFTVNLIIIIFLLTFLTGQVAAEEPLVLAEGDWPGIWAKNAVVATILENIGYKAETKLTGEALIYQGLASDSLDVYLGSWMPATRKKRQAVRDEFTLVTTNMTDCLYTMAVPTYVWEAGVKSHADLDKYADKFDHTMYVGAAGWDAAINMREAIKNNTYGLGDWKAITSSQTALMAHVKRAIKQKEWVVFVAWTPHWMNHLLELKYLKEPQKKIWKNPKSYVDTLVRKGFKQDYPQVYKFLEQVKIKTETGDKWIYQIGRKKRDDTKVAKEWIKNNLPTIKKWLAGVKAPNGKKAIKVLKNNINFN